jgi:hypothetical protein
MKGWGDLAFVAYHLVFWSFVRQTIADRIARPMARRWGIKKAAKVDRFGEQLYAIIYFTVFGLWGLVRRPACVRDGVLRLTGASADHGPGADVVVPHRGVLDVVPVLGHEAGDEALLPHARRVLVPAARRHGLRAREAAQGLLRARRPPHRHALDDRVRRLGRVCGVDGVLSAPQWELRDQPDAVRERRLRQHGPPGRLARGASRRPSQRRHPDRGAPAQIPKLLNYMRLELLKTLSFAFFLPLWMCVAAARARARSSRAHQILPAVPERAHAALALERVRPDAVRAPRPAQFNR